ncbi:DUF4348 domain-containing protein [Proteiniphilum sp. UBA5310]|uniref:DUF4348 domain-containing protein n=1 Tax=Proteiniphilum sp. UBA5310 TaxID=1947275 RepID=UPI00257F7677|nr:DUF4348 domain-containing protein [Proteiniphilum sp. UBA5310]
MRLYALVFSCLFLLFLNSCSWGTGKKDSFSGKEEEQIVKDRGVSSDSSDAEEEFDQFLLKFSEEESFQLKRIKFPIRVVVPNAKHQGMALMEETIGKYDWELLDLTYDSTFLTRTYDQYCQMVRYKNDTAVVEIRGINNGIYADYYFALIDKKWYLVTLYEASF